MESGGYICNLYFSDTESENESGVGDAAGRSDEGRKCHVSFSLNISSVRGIMNEKMSFEE